MINTTTIQHLTFNPKLGLPSDGSLYELVNLFSRFEQKYLALALDNRPHKRIET